MKQRNCVGNMFHWITICGLVVYSCSSILSILACWGIYVNWHVHWCIVVLAFLCTFCSVVLIPLCWRIFYWNFKGCYGEEKKVTKKLQIYIVPPSKESQEASHPPIYHKIGKLYEKNEILNGLRAI